MSYFNHHKSLGVILSAVVVVGLMTFTSDATVILEVAPVPSAKTDDTISLSELGSLSREKKESDWIANKYGIEVIEGTKRMSDMPRRQVSKSRSTRIVRHSRTYRGGGKSASVSEISSMIYQFNPKLRPGFVSQVANEIYYLSHRFGVDPRLMVSVVAVESSFNPRAVSRTGAIGLGQLKPATARWLGVRNPYSIKQNLYGMAKYLRFLLDHYHGNKNRAVAAYYRGQGHIDRRGVDRGARYYISKVNRVYTQL